jgi:hypothetical protein
MEGSMDYKIGEIPWYIKLLLLFVKKELTFDAETAGLDTKYYKITQMTSKTLFNTIYVLDVRVIQTGEVQL